MWWFGSGGVEWCAGRENDVNHFLVWGIGVVGLGKQIGMGGQRQSRRRGEVERGNGRGGEAGGQLEVSELVKLFNYKK